MQIGSLVEYIGHPEDNGADNLRILNNHGYSSPPQKNYPYLVIDGPIEMQFLDGRKPAIRIEGYEKVFFWIEVFRELQPPTTINIEEFILDENFA